MGQVDIGHDDPTKPPPPWQCILPVIVDRLLARGVRREDITFISGNGNHKKWTPDELRAFLGDALFDAFHPLGGVTNPMGGTNVYAYGPAHRMTSWTEPAALLIQEGLAKIGIKTPINKIPGSKWRSFALVKKNLPLHLENFGGWLNYTDYYFFWCYVSKRFFNSYRYSNAEIDQIVGEILYKPTSDPTYEPKAKRLVEIAFRDVPRIALWQPSLDVAMRKDLKGYEFNFHRQLDARSLSL